LARAHEQRRKASGLPDLFAGPPSGGALIRLFFISIGLEKEVFFSILVQI